MTVHGNIAGISRYHLQQLDELNQNIIPRHLVCDSETACALSSLTAAISREILLYVDRRGNVLYVAVGDSDTVAMVDISKRRSQERLSGIRCIHTHPKSSGQLSDADLTALVSLRLDCMLAIGVQEDGQPGSCGLAWGVLAESRPMNLLYRNIQQLEKIDVTAAFAEIEKAAQMAAATATKANGPIKAILVGLWQKGLLEETEESLSELAQLADTAGLRVADMVIQKRETPSPATYIGKGKAASLSLQAQVAGADCLVFDDELTPVQMRNLEHITGRAIIDRTMLILDIFAQRARSNEGKLQVELAQLRYMLPRLVGQGEALSRLGGGIGTRGPGETKLEVDRRRIRRRISELEERLTQTVRTRQLHRKERKAKEIPIVALVGYTNAGKSTLLNALTGADVLAEDKLFATLDTTVRRVELPNGQPVLLTDTVGFIRKLPHHLIAAFRATLEEVVEADVILHVLDATAHNADAQAAAVAEVLTYLDVAAKPTITVINKIDGLALAGPVQLVLGHFENSVAISAKNHLGLDLLLQKISEILPENLLTVTCFVPYNQMNFLHAIHREGKIWAESYLEEGVQIQASLPQPLYQRLCQAGISYETK